MDMVQPGAAIVAVLVAAFIRGFTGIGFAAFALAIISIFHPPEIAVPAVIVLEILISLILIPPVRHEVRWRPVGLLMIGAVALTPVGALLLLRIPADWGRIAVALAIGAVAVALLRSRTVRAAPGRLATVAVGGVAGILNGAVGISGPPIILFFVGTERAAGVTRASMMAAFLVIDVFTVLWFGVGGLFDRTTLLMILICLPSLVIGSQLGAWAFRRSDPDRYRERLLLILLALAAVVLVRGLVALGI